MSGGSKDTHNRHLRWPLLKTKLRSLKQKGETQTPTTAEPAKQKFPSTGDGSDSEESDADKLLDANKRPKVVGEKSNGSTCETSADNESDSLLDEIAQSLTDTEKTHQVIIFDYA